MQIRKKTSNFINFLGKKYSLQNTIENKNEGGATKLMKLANNVQEKNNSEFFTFRELMDILNIKSENTLRKAVQQGEIPGAIKIRGRWRIHKDTFYKIVSENNSAKEE